MTESFFKRECLSLLRGLFDVWSQILSRKKLLFCNSLLLDTYNYCLDAKVVHYMVSGWLDALSLDAVRATLKSFCGRTMLFMFCTRTSCNVHASYITRVLQWTILIILYHTIVSRRSTELIWGSIKKCWRYGVTFYRASYVRGIPE